ncbi:DUF2867 domain-containing protein [Streptomyces huiliensis]|uniref:DUF2867 domain-containing protein n=1 Tax=Streptomyces huiliensis TaxID=2876027 RepID=UPI001CC082BA|nr:DUF2867 domain-containing protein [Streptomyces huiliensis]MBZ4321329.1 DUF2867 domain-containing protein [Streptomyces huiliensis]
MRLPTTAHTSRPWRIHEIAGDFRVDDVWALPTPGGPDDFDRLIRQFTDGGERYGSSLAARALFAVRWKLGALLGWDRPGTGLDTRVPSLLDRLPADLREGPRGPGAHTGTFRSVYLTQDEWVCEIANRTVHAVRHIAWVPDGKGGHRGQMAVLVKPNGPLGTAYMAAIKPFRYFVVYPAMLRETGRKWRAGVPRVPTA